MSTPDTGTQGAAGPTSSATGAYDEPGGGWVLFAGIMLIGGAVSLVVGPTRWVLRKALGV